MGARHLPCFCSFPGRGIYHRQLKRAPNTTRDHSTTSGGVKRELNSTSDPTTSPGQLPADTLPPPASTGHLVQCRPVIQDLNPTVIAPSTLHRKTPVYSLQRELGWFNSPVRLCNICLVLSSDMGQCRRSPPGRVISRGLSRLDWGG